MSALIRLLFALACLATGNLTADVHPVQVRRFLLPEIAHNGAFHAIDLTAYFEPHDTATGPIATFQIRGFDDLTLRLFPHDAPQTVANFLTYVLDGDYDEAIFHRLFPGFVLQGGGFRLNRDHEVQVPRNPPVINEPGRSNTAGTLTMAKIGGDPNSATNQFFFNLRDNNEGTAEEGNLDLQNGGFTVFGQVTEPSLPALNALAAVPDFELSVNRGQKEDDTLTYANLPLVDMTVSDFNAIDHWSDLYDHWLVIEKILLSEPTPNRPLSFSVVSISHPAHLEAHLAGSTLTLEGLTAGPAEASVTIRALDPVTGHSLDVAIPITLRQPNVLEQYFPGLGPDTNGWHESAWYGWFSTDDFDSTRNIFHGFHGWQYCWGDGGAAYYLYDYGLGSWLYTSPTLYPYLYTWLWEGAWLLYQDRSGDPNDANKPRWFYVLGPRPIANTPGWWAEDGTEAN